MRRVFFRGILNLVKVYKLRVVIIILIGIWWGVFLVFVKMAGVFMFIVIKLCIWGGFGMVIGMGRVFVIILMEIFMKVIGKMVIYMVMVL